MVKCFQNFPQKKAKIGRKTIVNPTEAAANSPKHNSYRKCINNIQHYKKELCYEPIIVTILTVGSERHHSLTTPITERH